jgi:hypothetical protein
MTYLDLNTEFPPAKLDLEKGKLRWGGTWIPHKRGYFLDILAYGPPYYNYISLSKSHKTEETKAELIRFLLTLELWERTPGEKYMTAYEVWAKSLIDGPAFAEELSDLFSSLFRELDPDSYNFLFPARFLPRWIEGSDDLSLCKIRTYADPDVLEEFRFTLAALLNEIEEYREEIILPSDDQIRFERSTTTSYLASQGRCLPQWEASLMNSEFNEKELQALRCVVPVYPGGIRDTVIADISSNYSIRWIERSMRHILQYVPESAVTLHSSSFEKRLNDVVYTKGYHILRDIKKCGITYNSPDLFPVVAEELERFTGDRRFRRLKIFQNFFIQDDDIKYKAERGYGLGMANHVVTLCNIVIYRMTRNAVSQKYKNFKVKNITGNDDQDTVICGKKGNSLEIAQYFLNLELDIQGSLGNIVHAKKSVIKPYGLFYEQYDKRGWVDKESLVCNAIACAYLAPNIRVAKHYISSQSERFSSKWAREQLIALAHWWGSEFFDVRSELFIHFEIGGWLNTTSLGLKTSLRDLELLSEDYDMETIAFAYEVCKQFITPPRPLFKRKGFVNNFRYSGPARESDARIQIYTIGEEDLIEYYKKLTKFQRRYDTRLSKYESRVHQKALKKSLDAIFKDLLRRGPWYTIPDSVVEGESHMNELEVEPSSEFSTHSDDLISDLLLEKEVVYDDLIFKWDPKIPLKGLKYRIHTSLSDLLMASQFSNSGFLPILEFNLRNKANPNISRVLGRLRFPAKPRERDKFFNDLSLYIKKDRKKKYITRKDILSDEPQWGYQTEVYQVELEYSLEYLIEEDKSRGIEDSPPKQETEIETIPEPEEIDLSNMLDLIASGQAIGTLFSGDHAAADVEIGNQDHLEEEYNTEMFGDAGDY